MNENHKQAILDYLKSMPQTVSYKVDIGDEEIHVTWQEAHIRATAIFDESNEYGYAYYKNGYFIPGKYQAVIGNPWPEDLLNYLQKYKS